MTISRARTPLVLTALLLCAAAQVQAQVIGPTPTQTPPQTREALASPSRGALAPDRVAGRVISARDGHVLGTASVNLQDIRTGQTLASTKTDAEGRYRFDPQPSGKYRLIANAPGYQGMAYQAHDGYATSIVLGAGLDTGSLVFTLVPSATILGRVLDEAGDPVAHAQLTLYKQNPNNVDTENEGTNHIVRARNAQTEDDGSFEFAGVAPGHFFLSANAVPWYATHPRPDPANLPANVEPPYRTAVDPALDVAYPTVFYPNSLEDSGAAPIVIEGGERITANFVMQPQRAVTLTLSTEPVKGDARRIPQLTHTVFGLVEPVQVQQVQFTGNDGSTLSLTGMPPGHYAVNALAVDLSTGSAAMDMRSLAVPPASVQITLQAANGTTLPTDVQVSLRNVTAGALRGGMLTQRHKDDAETVFPSVPPGDYQYTVFGERRAVNVISVTVNGKPVPDKHLHVSGGESIAAVLRVSTYSPTLEGLAKQEGKGFAGAMVVLVPATAAPSLDLFRRDQSDLDGSFTLNNVVPGNYLLIAVEDGWKLPRWNDSTALTPYLTHATPVIVAESGAETVHLSDAVTTQRR
jgi:hypothetical protein